jgi:hypothetical protein
MPTFIAYKKGEKIETVTGAVPAKITVSHACILLYLKLIHSGSFGEGLDCLGSLI